MIEKKSYKILERRVREVTVKNYRSTLPIFSKLYPYIKRKMHEKALKKNMDKDD